MLARSACSCLLPGDVAGAEPLKLQDTVRFFWCLSLTLQKTNKSSLTGQKRVPSTASTWEPAGIFLFLFCCCFGFFGGGLFVCFWHSLSEIRDRPNIYYYVSATNDLWWLQELTSSSPPLTQGQAFSLTSTVGISRMLSINTIINYKERNDNNRIHEMQIKLCWRS